MCTNEKKSRNEWCISKAPFMIQRNKMFFVNDACFPFTYSHMFRDYLHHVFFETCWDRVPFFCVYCTHHFHDFAYSYFYVYYLQKFALPQLLVYHNHSIVNSIILLCDKAPGRADTENPPIGSRDCRSDMFQVSDWFCAYQTGNRTFQMADAEEIEVCKLSPRNTKQFLFRRRRPPIWAWFGHLKQSGKTRGAAEHENGEVIMNSSWASRFYRRTQIQFNTVRKTISIWHEALWYNDALDKRTETTVSIIVVQEIRRAQSVWFWQSSRAEYSLHLPFLSFLTLKVV